MTLSVQNQGTATNNTGSTLSLPVGTAIAKGDTIVVVTTYAVTVPGLTDSQGNVYTLADTASPNNTSGSTGFRQLWYCLNCKALSTSDTISMTGKSGTVCMSAFSAHSNVPGTWSVDGHATPLVGNSAAPTAGPITPTAAGTLMVGAVGFNGVPTLTQPGSFTSPPFTLVSSTFGIGGGTWVNPGTSPVTYAPTLTSGPWCCFFISFKFVTQARNYATIIG